MNIDLIFKWSLHEYNFTSPEFTSYYPPPQYSFRVTPYRDILFGERVIDKGLKG